MYKIFLDKSKTFECDIQIEGASLNESEVRLYLEAENFLVTLKGKINSNGSVKIPIGKLKGILKENYTGKIFLEVIAEDTRFTPWSSQYKTDVSKKVQVTVNESLNEEDEEEEKPKISFKLKEQKEEINVDKNITEISEILKKNHTKKQTLYNNPIVFDKLIETYCTKNSITDVKYVDEIKKRMFNIIKQ